MGRDGAEDPDDPNNTVIFLNAVHEVCGDSGVRAVQKAKGGLQLGIPQEVSEDHWLAAALGFDKANRVCSALHVLNNEGRRIAHPRITIPLGIDALARQAIAEAERLLLAGRTTAEAARAAGVAERTVWRHRARMVAEGRLAPLAKRSAPDVIDPLLLAGFSVSDVLRKTRFSVSAVQRRRSALIAKGKLDTQRHADKANRTIELLLLAGGALDEIAHRAKCQLATVLSVKRCLVAEGRIGEGT